jgi:hypothetical protein
MCVLQYKLQKDLLKICHGSPNPDCQIAVATKFLTPDIFGFSVRNVLHALRSSALISEIVTGFFENSCTPTIYRGARGGAVGRGTALQV